MSSRPVWHRLAATGGFAILPAYAQSASNVQRAGGHAPADLNAPQALPPLKAQEHATYDVAVDALSPLTESQIRALRRRLIAPSAQPRPALISLPNPCIPCKRLTCPQAARRRLCAPVISAPRRPLLLVPAPR